MCLGLTTNAHPQGWNDQLPLTTLLTKFSLLSLDKSVYSLGNDLRTSSMFLGWNNILSTLFKGSWLRGWRGNGSRTHLCQEPESFPALTSPFFDDLWQDLPREASKWMYSIHRSHLKAIISKGKWLYAIDVYGHPINNNQKNGNDINCSRNQLQPLKSLYMVIKSVQQNENTHEIMLKEIWNYGKRGW